MKRRRLLARLADAEVDESTPRALGALASVRRTNGYVAQAGEDGVQAHANAPAIS
jgi:hypothetical protein